MNSAWMAFLTPEIRALVEGATGYTEVRIRAGRPVLLTGAETPRAVIPTAGEVRAMAAAMLGHAAHARQEELRRGFVTLPGGCRAGLCGRAAVENGRVRAMQDIASICIRVAREVRGCAAGIDWSESTLLVSPPGYGKTTILRDAARLLSERGLSVGVADERSELAACAQGVPTFDVGARTDVLDGAPKAEAMRMLLRAMSPQVIITDELGRAEDAAAVLEASRCGVRVIASAHARDYADAAARPSLRKLMAARAFARVVSLCALGRVGVVWDGEGKPV